MVVGAQNFWNLIIPNATRSLYHLETLWFKDDEPIENSGVGHTFNDLWNRTLSLLNADPSHSGRYSCRVSTKSLRSEPVTAGANVTILGKTTIKCWWLLLLQLSRLSRSFSPSGNAPSFVIVIPFLGTRFASCLFLFHRHFSPPMKVVEFYVSFVSYFFVFYLFIFFLKKNPSYWRRFRWRRWAISAGSRRYPAVPAECPLHPSSGTGMSST